MDLTKQFCEAIGEAAKYAPLIINNDKKSFAWGLIAHAIATAGLVDPEKLGEMMKADTAKETTVASQDEKTPPPFREEEEKSVPVTGRAKLASIAAAQEIKSEASLPDLAQDEKSEQEEKEAAHNDSLKAQKPTLRRSVVKKEEPAVDEWTDEARASHKEELDRIEAWKSNFGSETMDECVEQFMQGAGKKVADLTPLNIKPFCIYMDALIDDLEKEDQHA